MIAGSGTVTLANTANNYTGPTTVVGGMLQTGSFIPQLQNGSFANPVLNNNSYTYYSNLSAANQALLVWTSSGNSGTGGCLINNATAWNYTTPYPSGSQAFSLQKNSVVSESIYLVPGTYTIAWSEESRNGQVNPYYFEVNGVPESPLISDGNGTTWSTTSAVFTIPTAGSYSLGFSGTITSADDSVGLNNVVLSAPPATNGANLPSTTAVNLAAAGASWSFTGGSQTIASLAGVAGTSFFNNGALTTTGSNLSTTFTGAISGTGSLTAAGSGSLLVLAGSNSYTGATTITAGTLNLANSGALAGGGTVTFAGGMLQYSVSNTSDLSSRIVSSTGPISINTNGQSVTFANTLGNSNSGGLTKLGSGTLTLTANNVYGGPTVIQAGTLRLTGTKPLPANLVAYYPLNGSAADVTGNGNNGSLQGSPTFVSGLFGAQAISLNGSSQYVTVPYAADLGNINNWTVSAWVNLGSSPSATSGILGTRFGSDNTYDLKLNGNSGVHSDIGNGGSWLNTTADANSTTINSSTWYYVTETVTSGGSYAIYLNGSVISSGTGTFTGTPLLMKSSESMGIGEDYNGEYFKGSLQNVAVFNQALSASQVAVLYSNGVGAGILPATPMQIAAGATLDLNGAYQTVASLSDLTPGGYPLAGGGSVINSSTGGLTLTLSATGGSTTFSGAISDNGAANAISLVMAGSGTQVLAGSNTYSGGTTISAGTLQAGNAYSLGNGGPLTINGGLLDLHGNSPVNVFSSLSGTGGVISDYSTGGGVSTLSAGLAGSNTCSGALQNGPGTAVALSLSGTGFLLLSGTNNYSGGTTISGGGTLQLGNSGAIGNAANSGIGGYPLSIYGSTLDLRGQSPMVGALTGNAGALITSTSAGVTTTLTVNTAASSTFAGTINNPGTPINLVKTGSGTLALTGTSSYTGTTSINQGTLVVTSIANAGGGTGSGPSSLGNPSTVTSGTINMGSAGPATLQFIGPQASTTRVINLQGPATIDASGTANNNNFILAGSSSITVSTGTSQNLTLTGTGGGYYVNGGNSTPLGGEIGGSINLGAGGALTKNGPGTWTLDAANTFGGGTTLNAGTLLVDNASGSALGSGNLTINGGTLTSLWGIGSISGTVLSGSGAYTIAPGNAMTQALGPAGNLTVGGLSTSNSSTLYFDVGAPVANNTYGGDLITVASAGPLTIGASTTIALSSLPGTQGDYRLLADSNTGTLAGVNTANFILPSPASNSLKYSLSTTADSGYLDLVVGPSVTAPSYSLSSSAAFHTLIVGGSSSIAVTLANLGGGAQPDTILYTGLSATTTTGGTISGAGSGSVAPSSSAPTRRASPAAPPAATRSRRSLPSADPAAPRPSCLRRQRTP